MLRFLTNFFFNYLSLINETTSNAKIINHIIKKNYWISGALLFNKEHFNYPKYAQKIIFLWLKINTLAYLSTDMLFLQRSYKNTVGINLFETRSCTQPNIT